MDSETTSYVLVTPARNEEDSIKQTIESVVRQSLRPKEWVIVSDGSTDATNRIVADFAQRQPWVRLLALPARADRCFAAVVKNTEAGVRHLVSRQYNFLGLLDADVSFQEDYFEQLIRRFQEDPKLGLAGGVVVEVGMPRDRFPKNRFDVPGAVQFFRRECFESLGGLLPIPEGGWDAMTCAVARMNGFKTRLITDLVVDHLKPRNISQGGTCRRKWQMGVRDYAAGYHPLFELVKCAGRVTEPPFLIAAVAWWIGYCTALLQRRTRVVPKRVIAHVQGEQMNRLRRQLRLPAVRRGAELKYFDNGPALLHMNSGAKNEDKECVPRPERGETGRRKV
jgi:poly-beta-1,6-N-acetyl-D-glucosamine synthase